MQIYNNLLFRFIEIKHEKKKKLTSQFLPSIRKKKASIFLSQSSKIFIFIQSSSSFFSFLHTTGYFLTRNSLMSLAILTLTSSGKEALFWLWIIMDRKIVMLDHKLFFQREALNFFLSLFLYSTRKSRRQEEKYNILTKLKKSLFFFCYAIREG